MLVLVVLALVAGAAVAGAAALTRHKAQPAVVVKTVAQVPPATSSPTGTTTTPSTPGFTTPTTPQTSVPKIPGAGSTLPRTSTKVPKIPFFNSTPKTSGTTTIPKETIPKETTTTPSGSSGSESSGTAQQPSAILLDTNAASTYDPYHYPEANFGSAELAIDGDTTTAWTAQVEPTVAPRMAEGLVLDLKTARHLGVLEVHTSTPGMTVEVYGSAAHTLPATITDPAWKQLSPPHALKKTAKLKLHKSTKTYRFVLVWITKAPAASVGTPQAPGRVALNELTLFPPAAS